MGKAFVKETDEADDDDALSAVEEYLRDISGTLDGEAWSIRDILRESLSDLA